MSFSPIRRPMIYPFSRLDRQLSIFVKRPVCTGSNVIALRAVRTIIRIVIDHPIVIILICRQTSCRNLYAFRSVLHEPSVLKCLMQNAGRRFTQHCHIFQFTTPFKRTASYLCHTRRDRYTFQTNALIKRITICFRQVVRQRYFCQTAALRKRIVPNACHTVRERYTLQTAALPKRLVPNACHAARECDAL